MLVNELDPSEWREAIGEVVEEDPQGNTIICGACPERFGIDPLTLEQIPLCLTCGPLCPECAEEHPEDCEEDPREVVRIRGAVVRDELEVPVWASVVLSHGTDEVKVRAYAQADGRPVELTPEDEARFVGEVVGS